MATCTRCGSEIAQDAAFCQHCGVSQADAPTTIHPALQPRKGGGFRRVLKWIGVGCGGLIGIAVFLVIVGLILTALAGESMKEDPTTKAATERTAKVEATAGPTRMPTVMPTSAPVAEPTPTPVPTATPTPVPLQMELTDLLEEYEQNKVRANTRLRYQENGKIPVATTGYVEKVEEHYVVITPTQERFPLKSLYCYYADTETALHLTKGQSVSVTGRIRGEDGYTSRVYMFACDFEGIDLEKSPTVSAQELRRNTVQVFCISDSIFSPGYKGTGVIVDADEGIILTVHHVVADENECAKIEVALPGIEDRVLATTLKHCASIDRARVRISPEVLSDLSLQPIYRSTAPAQTDQEIYFWGYGPDELRMGAGVVVDVNGENIITDVYAVPGDSGSPVYDEYGHLLGTMSRSNRSDRSVFTGDEC